MKTATIYTAPAIALALLIVLPASTTAGNEDKLVLEYSVHAKKKKVGTTKAVITNTDKGQRFSMSMSVKAKVMGKSVSFSSRSKGKLDTDWKAVSFSAVHDRMGRQIEIAGKRTKGGYEVVRKKDEKVESFTVKDGEFDFVSIEPAIIAGKVGSKKTYKILFAQSGEVRKSKVTILDRETREVFGKERVVTHFRMKGSRGTLEEWRTDDGIILKSLIKTPLGTLTVEPVP